MNKKIVGEIMKSNEERVIRNFEDTGSRDENGRFLPGHLSYSNEQELQYFCECLDEAHFINSRAIPYEKIIEVVEFLPYADTVRVMFMFSFLTGCRPSELDRMQYRGKDSFISGSHIYWRCGKNQKGQWRKEYLPEWFLRELLYYRQTHRVSDNSLFGINCGTYRRMFNVNVRPLLSKEWQIKENTPNRAGMREYLLQLKGTRKSFCILVFAQEMIKWKDDATAALSFASARLKHSTTGVTVNHYLSSYRDLNINKWKGYTAGEILSLATQKHIEEYDPVMNMMRLVAEKKQSRIQDFEE
jgi:hypothetical protein